MMRLTCTLAIALWLSFPAAGLPAAQQDSANSPNPNEQAPTSSPPAQNAPAPQPPLESAPPAPDHPQTPAVETKPPQSAVKKKKHPTSASGTRRRRKRTAPVPSAAPRKVVVREGGAREPAAQIAPGMAPEEATRLRQHAVEWLGSTDGQLKQLAGRTLDARQQETVGQIRNYMDGARSALKEGDVGRASTLAQKAHLLSEDLVGH